MKKNSPEKNQNIVEVVQPLGVNKHHGLVTFSVSIPNAQECKLHLYQGQDNHPKKTIHLSMENCFGNVFTYHMKEEEFIYDSYCYEALGKKFIDPYARRITGRETYGKFLCEEEEDKVRGSWDFSDFDWEKVKRPNIPYSELILYKLHVRGFTKASSSMVKCKGTYLGIIQKIPYLKELGINAVLLMPTVEFDEIICDTFAYSMPSYTKGYRYMDMSVLDKEQEKVSHKLNYWGFTKEYHYFAPKSSYAYEPSKAITEFKTMVRELHRNGIEVLMEMNFDQNLRPLFILECLRYWATEYQVDGFHLTRELGIERLAATDPYLSSTKILGQYWNTDSIYDRDIIPQFKNLAEYNDNFLIDTRRFLKGDENQISKFMECFRCNPQKKGRINYITDHNGFTLMDLYSYERKHNESNDENNQDGTDYNYSWNCGAEGVTRKKKVNELRLQMRKNALTVLLLSQGVPMILAGDEFGNSQAGNNNAYCQDNDNGWIDWKRLKGKDSLFHFTKELIALRKEHKILRNETELRIMDYISCGYPDISFHGTKAWCPEYANYCRTLGILLCGKYAMNKTGTVDNFFYFAFNMHWDSHKFDLPNLPKEQEWKLIRSTDGNEDATRVNKESITRQSIELKPRSIVILMSHLKESK